MKNVNFSFLKIVSLILTVIFSSCQSHKQTKQETQPVIEKDTFQKSVLIPSVTSRKNSSYSYAVYLPQQYSDSIRIPAIIFFDPHADGSFPLNKYKTLSEKFGVVLIGSNDSKNGLSFEQTNAIAQLLIEEVKERFSVDGKQVSLCGFSGGAKVALVAGMSVDGASSIVYCGAGLPPQQISNLPPALGFAGIRDLNYTEVIETDKTLDEKKIPHSLITWNGKHEWVDSVSFADAFYWIKFRVMENKTTSIDHGLVNEFRQNNSKPLARVVDEWMRLKKMISFFSGIADASSYLTTHEALIRKKEFITAMQKMNNDMEAERGMKQSYYDAVAQKDLSWWKTEIERLTKEKGAKEAMNQRLLGYISLMYYSLSNASINQNDIESAQKTLAIYKLADPANPDQPYLQACLYAITNNNDAAIGSLREAIRLGFRDKVKLMQERAFVSLKNLPEFKTLTNSLR